MIKEFIIQIQVEENDFCFIDLKQAIFEGADNIGNHNIIDVKEVSQ